MEPQPLGATKQKIAFFVSSMEMGGTENVVLSLIKNFDREKFIIDLVLMSKKGRLLGEVPADVSVFDLNKKNKFDFLNLIGKYKNYLKNERPDVVISFLTYTNIINLLAARKITAVKAIICERTAIKTALSRERLGWLKSLMVKYLFPKAHKITANSYGIKNQLTEMIGNKKDIEVIANPINLERVKELSQHAVEHKIFSPYIISVGRLVKDKSYDVLLQAFVSIKADHKLSLVVIGDGDQKDFLKKLANILGVQENVFFLGELKNPFPLLKKANCFVLSSKTEGFPNVILEAMALGVPVVSTDCDFGPSEIIRDGGNGLLTPVGDAKKLSQAIKTILENNKLATKFSKNGLETVNKFDIYKIVKKFENLVAG